MPSRGQSILVYGANGYTGRLIVAEMSRRQLRPVLAGRNRDLLSALAKSFHLDYRVAEIGHPRELARALEGIAVVLNVAGPFASTSAGLVEACLTAGAHYLDISGEFDAIEAVARYSAVARGRRLMLMAGVGFDVVPSDCLVVFVSTLLPAVTCLRIGIGGLRWFSAGSAATMARYAGQPVQIRRDGRLTAVAPGTLEHTFDFGDGPERALAVNWGDLTTAFYSTGVANIAVYFKGTPSLEAALLVSRWGAMLPSPTLWIDFTQSIVKGLVGPPPGGTSRATVVVEATAPGGRSVIARLHTPDVYELTATVAADIGARVAAGDMQPGFQTPGRMFGADYVLGFAGVSRELLSS